MKRLLKLLPKCHDSLDLLRELYYSFSNNKAMQRIIFKAMKYQDRYAGASNCPSPGFKYIEKKLGCEPMFFIHDYLEKLEIDFGDYLTCDYEEFAESTKEHIALWKTHERKFLKYMQVQRTKLLLEKSVLLFCNLMVYLKYGNDISLLIFAIVNTIGLVVFIILDYDCCVVDSKKREGNLASIKKRKKRALAKGKRLNGLYQIAGGMGLIINLTMFMIQWFEQEALF